MPEGSLIESIATLEASHSGLLGLEGTFSAAADLSSVSLAGQISSFEGVLTSQISGVFSIDTATALGQISQMFEALRSESQALPLDALAGFAERITQANSALNGDFLGQLEQTLAAIQGISGQVPADPTGIASALLDQLLSIIGSIEGPESEVIQSWINTMQEMHRTLMPLIEQLQTAPDAEALVVGVYQRALDRVMAVFGFDGFFPLTNFIDDFPNSLLDASLLDAVNTNISATLDAYSASLGSAAGTYNEFRDTIAALDQQMAALRAALRPVIQAMGQITEAAIFQPNALENFLRQKIDESFGVQVNETATIEDPYNALLDRIDEAIEGIDLDFVQQDINAFFDNVQQTIQAVDLPNVGNFLDEQLAPVTAAVQDLQTGVTDLLAQIQAFFDDLVEQIRTLASSAGTFQPDGSFEYHFTQDLRAMFEQARLVLSGDPANPSAPSLAGTIDEFQTTIDSFLSQLNDILAPIQSSVESVTSAAVDGINDFEAFITGLDLPTLMEQLRQQVETIVEALTPIDFDQIIDPVIAELEENADKLREIDPSSLNDILREALKTALDVIISIDFTAEITNPLDDEFEAIKAVPQSAIDALQERYEMALQLLDNIKPDQLLEVLYAAFDTISAAVNSVDIASLLGPLDELHQEYLQEPLAALQPSVLLQPVVEAFQEITSLFDDVNSGELIGPLIEQLDAFKAAVSALDITVWVDDLLAAIDQVKQTLNSIRPSDIFGPLVDDFNNLVNELDRFKPSVVFQPAVELAAPLTDFLAGVQQTLVDALTSMFEAPLALLDRLQPTALVAEITAKIDAVLALVRSINLPARFSQLKGLQYDLNAAVEAGGDANKIALTILVDPDRRLGDLATIYNDLIAALEGLKSNIQVADDLTELYEEVKTRVIGLLPPYAQAVLDVETFKRLMALTDPTRFITALDERFETIKAKLIPIDPSAIVADLDQTYEAVLALVDGVDISDSLNTVRDNLNQVKDLVNILRIDFLGEDIDDAVASFRSVIEGLDPAQFFGELDALHAELLAIVADLLPSALLGGLQTLLDQVQAIVDAVNPRTVLGEPLNAAWEAIQDALDQIDFTIILSPLVERLDELQVDFIASLQRTEDAFDAMLGAASGVLSGSGASASVSVGG